jgi:predicted ATP-grasp superfamily ATP-dependent carboligase
LEERLGYTGHASIEFKWDHRDGLYKYIEINPRIPASVSLDEASDVSTVWTTYRLALGDDVAASPLRQRDGVIYVKLLEDVVNRLADGERLAAILRQYLRLIFKRRVGAHFTWHDPRPGLAFALWFGRARWASLRRQLRAGLNKTVPGGVAGAGA